MSLSPVDIAAGGGAQVRRGIALYLAAMLIFVMTSGVGTLALTPIGIAVWESPSATTLVMMVAIGMIAAAGDAVMLQAFRRAPASTLAPFQFTQVVWGLLIGLAWFAEFPDAAALAGTALIVASGLGLLRRT